MKKFLSILLVLVMAAGLMTTAFAAGLTVEPGDTFKAVIKVSDIGDFQSCLATVTSEGGVLVLDKVEMTLDGSAVDVSEGDSGIKDDTKSLFAWNPATGLIAYATGAEGGKSVSAAEAVFGLTFKVADGKEAPTAPVPVTVSITFYNDKGESKPLEVTVENTADIKVSASAEFKLGDVNMSGGDPDLADLMYLARALSGWTGYEIKDKTLANVNKSEETEPDLSDLMYLARALSGWTGYSLD